MGFLPGPGVLWDPDAGSWLGPLHLGNWGESGWVATGSAPVEANSALMIEIERMFLMFMNSARCTL